MRFSTENGNLLAPVAGTAQGGGALKAPTAEENEDDRIHDDDRVSWHDFNPLWSRSA
jgi:hypothetical protein